MAYFVIRSLNEVYEIVFGLKGQQTFASRVCDFLYTTAIFPVGAVNTINIKFSFNWI